MKWKCTTNIHVKRTHFERHLLCTLIGRRRWISSGSWARGLYLCTSETDFRPSTGNKSIEVCTCVIYRGRSVALGIPRRRRRQGCRMYIARLPPLNCEYRKTSLLRLPQILQKLAILPEIARTR
jgi:hypothetical protein